MLVNAFVITDDDETSAIFVDPGWGSERILEWAQDIGTPIERIVDTHGHFDHCFQNALFKEHTGAELLIHKDDEVFLERQVETGRKWGAHVPPSPVPDGYLTDGEELKLGKEKLTVMHCPGHSPGSVCLHIEDGETGDMGASEIPGGRGRGPMVITGDVIFAGSIGRTDFPGGDFPTLIRSIKTRLMTLAPETRLFPGHNEFTTVEIEARSNPFVTGDYENVF